MHVDCTKNAACAPRRQPPRCAVLHPQKLPQHTKLQVLCPSVLQPAPPSHSMGSVSAHTCFAPCGLRVHTRCAVELLRSRRHRRKAPHVALVGGRPACSGGLLSNSMPAGSSTSSSSSSRFLQHDLCPDKQSPHRLQDSTSENMRQQRVIIYAWL